MSDKQFEPCTLTEATHVEINGEVHEIKIGGKVLKSGKSTIDGQYLCISIQTNMYSWIQIPQEAFPLLGIKCLRGKKQNPIEFEATFAHYDGKWHPLYSLDDGVSYQNNKKAKFRCVEILEEKK
jgi:hypothetical protein